MGQLYLTQDLEPIPTFGEMGPDALEVSPEEFRSRLRPFRGEIKGVLTRAQFVAGIGNAYADEILWHAQIHPYRKRTSLNSEEIDRLHDSHRTPLREPTEKGPPRRGEPV